MKKINIGLIGLFALAAAFAIVTIIGGNRSDLARAILLIFAFPIFYFSWRDAQENFFDYLREPVSLGFLALVGFIGISVFVSADKYATVLGLLSWTAYFLIFLASMKMADEKTVRLASYFVLLVADATALVAVFTFLSLADNFGYLRLDSMFGQHNFYGGFLLMPIFLAFGLFWTKRSRFGGYFAFFSAVVLLAALGLTFSRGSYLSFAAAGLIGSIFLGKKYGFQLSKYHLKTFLFVLALSLVLSFSVYKVKLSAAAPAGAEVSGLYAAESLSENGVTARFHYFADGLKLIAERPLGVGFGHYGESVKIYRTDVAFYASNPHNTFIAMLAELGVAGGLVFLVFILLILARIYRGETKAGPDSLVFFISLGLLASVGHHLVENDWVLPANAFLFFVFAGFLFGLTKRPLSALVPAGKSRAGSFAFLFGSLSGLVLIFFGYCLYMSGDYLNLGSYFINAGKSYQALEYFDEAKKFDPYNPDLYYNRAVAFYNQGQIQTASSAKLVIFGRALNELSKAMVLKPEKPLFFSLQAKIYRAMGSTSLEIGALKQAIAYNPFDAVFEAERLAIIYDEAKQFDEVIALAGPFLTKYPLELFHDPFWVNPYKDDVKAAIADLYKKLGNAYTKLKQPDKAKSALEAQLQFEKDINLQKS